MLTGAMLAAVASLLTGASKLQRAVISAAAASQEGGQISEASPIWPIYAPIKVSGGLAWQPKAPRCAVDSSRQRLPVVPVIQII